MIVDICELSVKFYSLFISSFISSAFRSLNNILIIYFQALDPLSDPRQDFEAGSSKHDLFASDKHFLILSYIKDVQRIENLKAVSG